MHQEAETKLVTALSTVAERLSSQSREQLSYHVDGEARDALLAAIQALDSGGILELALEAAIERLRDKIAEERGTVSFVDANPFHPCHRRRR
jgi:hypothetical protein